MGLRLAKQWEIVMSTSSWKSVFTTTLDQAVVMDKTIKHKTKVDVMDIINNSASKMEQSQDFMNCQGGGWVLEKPLKTGVLYLCPTLICSKKN